MAPSLVAGAAMGLVVSWWYARRVKIPLPAMTRGEVTEEAKSLLKLGFAFMLSGLLMMGASYGVRAIILRMDGLDAAGFYSAAWTLGGLYVGIILQAMGADFYPRLVGVADDNRECNRLVNEQTLVSLLLAGPGVIGTIIFAPLIITLFYSPEFVRSGGSPTLDLPWDRDARHYLAHGIHHRCEESAVTLHNCGSRLDTG